MSYGMFLLLLIHETKMVRKKLISCTHSLHNFQFTCFGRHNQIAFFKMQTILPHGVKLPPQKIKLPDQFSREKELREELSNLAVHSKLGNLIIYRKGWQNLLPPLCVQMDFMWTFEANAKCNNINYVWSHFYKILVVLKHHRRPWAHIFDTDIFRSINISQKAKYTTLM